MLVLLVQLGRCFICVRARPFKSKHDELLDLFEPRGRDDPRADSTC